MFSLGFRRRQASRYFFSDHQASPVVISDLIGSPGFAGDHLGFLSHRISSPGIAGDQLGISEPLPICKLSSRRICNLGSPHGGSRISPVLSIGSRISDLLAADLGSRISDLSPNHCSDLAGSLYRISDLLAADLGSPRGGSRISDLRSLSEPLVNPT